MYSFLTSNSMYVATPRGMYLWYKEDVIICELEKEGNYLNKVIKRCDYLRDHTARTNRAKTRLIEHFLVVNLVTHSTYCEVATLMIIIILTVITMMTPPPSFKLRSYIYN